MTGDAGGDNRPLPEPIFKQSAAEEVADELQFHLDMRTRELLERGTAPEIAAQLARDRFADFNHVSGQLRQLAEHREHSVRRTRYFTNLLQDIHFALRMLRRRPAFALLAVLTIGLGIGASTAIYGVVDAVMLRPLPFANPGKLVAVWVTEQRFREDATLNSWWDAIVMGHEEYNAIRARATTISDVALWGRSGMLLSTPEGPVPLTSVRVTSNLLATLQVRPALGRGFLPGEDALNGPMVAMLSWEEWQSRWHGDSSIVGRSIQLGAYPWRIVGILPRGLRLDRSTAPAALWTPALRDSGDIPERHNRNYAAVARLKPGASTAQASAEVSAILHDAAVAGRGEAGARGVAGRVEQWQVDQTRTVRASLWILFGAVVLLLLIACVNVASLMLGEAARRRPEISARAALGAAPGRIARQLLTESVAISTAGALVGTVIASLSIRLLVAMAPMKIPGVTDVRLDYRVLGFAILAAATTGILFGLAPVIMLARSAGRTSVRDGMQHTARGAKSLQHSLIAVEVALSVVLLTGCALLGRSLQRLTDTAPGFNADGLAVVQLIQQRAFMLDDERQRRFFPAAARELAAIPGVSGVSAVSQAPFTQGGSSSPVKSDAREYGPDERGGNAQQRAVLPNYFDVMGIPVLAGRGFTKDDRDGSENVIVISEAEARRDFPHVAPVGRRLYWQGKWRTVVGIVADVKYAQLGRPDEPTLYAPMDQYSSGQMFVIRSRLPGPAIEGAIRERLASIEPAVSFSSLTPLGVLIGKSYGEEKYRTLIASLFGALAAVLATIGIFGVVSRSVARRTRESGIRIALGASSGTLTRLLMRETISGLAAGLALGLPLAMVVAELLKPYLFGITARDPLALAVPVVLLIGAGTVATLIPARQASRTDPTVVLRSD